MNLVERLRKDFAGNDAGLPVECFVDFDDVQKLLTAIETLMGALRDIGNGDYVEKVGPGIAMIRELHDDFDMMKYATDALARAKELLK